MATTAKLYKKVFAYFFLKKVSRKKTDDGFGVAFATALGHRYIFGAFG